MNVRDDKTELYSERITRPFGLIFRLSLAGTPRSTIEGNYGLVHRIMAVAAQHLKFGISDTTSDHPAP